MVALGLAAGPATGRPTAPAADMSFHDVGGAARSISALAGHPAVLLFWRSDCAPCRLELGYLAGLEAAARPGRLVAIALEDAASARSTIARLPQPPTDAWVADRPAAEVLVAFNGQPPRLPLAVSLDRNGRVCQRHVGLLGTDRVHQWVRQCS